jgi:hypothetical protein
MPRAGVATSGGKPTSGGARRSWWVLLVAVSAVHFAAAGELVHYPGAWLDASGGGSAYVSNDRLDRVHAFYRQFLFELPSAAGSSLFCLDAVDRADACRRFLRLQDLSGAGVGTRIESYQLP